MRLFSTVFITLLFFSSVVSRSLGQSSLFTADLVKFKNFIQFSPLAGTADASDPFDFSATFEVDIPDPDFVPSLSIKPGNKPALGVPYDDANRIFGGVLPYESESELNEDFPDGTMTVSIDSVFTGTENYAILFASSVWPPIPHVSNWQALQAIDPDPTKLVEVKWDASGGNELGRAQLVVYDEGGGRVFRSLHPTDPGALTSSSTSVSFAFDALAPDQTYFAELTFYNATRLDDSSAHPAVLAAYASRTRFLMKTAGTGTGGENPVLVLVQPGIGATEIDTTTLILFGFSQPMQTNGTPSIQWSSNVDSNKFSYAWAPGSTNLICAYAAPGLPSGQLISWTLNPATQTATLLNTVGNPLITTSGQFTTKISTETTPPELGKPLISGPNLIIPITTEANREVFLESTAALGSDALWTDLGSTNFSTGQGSFSIPLQDLLSTGGTRFIRAR